MRKKNMYKRLLSAVLIGQMVFTSVPVMAEETTGPPASQDAADASNKPEPDGNKLRMWYTSPGTLADWENTALVIGNGRTGAILLGQVGTDQIHFNEKTLWRGGPSESRSNYDGGNKDAAVTQTELEAVRQKADDHTQSVFPLGTSTVWEVWGDGDGMGQYQDFGDLYLDFSGTGVTNENVENYVRDLDMRTGIASVNYDYSGVHYEREYLASHPDGVAAVRLTAAEDGMLSFTASVETASGLTTAARAENGKITVSGTVDDNQMQCEMQAQIVADGGTVNSNSDGTVDVEGADAVTIVYAADTDYKNEYPAYRTGETAAELNASLAATVDAAAAKSYGELRSAHVADHSELFGRVEIDLGGECAQKPTDEMMADYRAGEKDPVLEEMIYQFGRYLTIASSREGDELPSNLCGIWMIGDAGTYWGADFHFNVNVQMNYWPAYQTNLAECGSVFTEYMESLVIPGRVTAERSAGMATENHVTTPVGEGNGFLVNTQNNPFGCTAPFGSQEYGWNITGSSWAMQNVYDQYLYTGDIELLRNTIYPMLKEMATFWNGFLWWSDYQDRLVVGPSFSAEQGPTVNGSTYDQSLVWELYRMVIEASEILDVDEEERAVWQENQSLLNPIMIGDEGQIKEWYEETTTGKAQAESLPEVAIPNFGAGGSTNQGSPHRHVSQLIGLYPGTLINQNNEEWMEAAKTTLQIRNLGGGGWSKAHKINMWARTGDGGTAYELISAMLSADTSGIRDNFLDAYPPYQIDGNYGLTAGINETLLQSQLGYTQFLPALPSAWADGNISGIVARGNFVIDMEWSDGEADRFAVTSRNGGTFTGEYTGLASCLVKKSDGTVIEPEQITEDKISFETEKGASYTIELNTTPEKLQRQIEEAKTISGQMEDELLAAAKAVLDACIAQSGQVVADQNAEQYYEQTKTLSAACDTAEKAIQLKEAYDAAKAIYQEADKEAEWTTYTEMVKELQVQLEAAEEVFAKEDAGAADYQTAAESLNAAAEALFGLSARLEVVFAPEGSRVEKGTEVTLSSEFPDLQIRYTTDGNAPVSFSNLYEEPIILEKEKTTIKAALFSGKTRMSDVDTQVYIAGTEGENMAPAAVKVTETNYYLNDSTYDGWKAVDGNGGTRWATNVNTYSAILELTFAEPVTVDSAEISQYYLAGLNDIMEFNIEYWNGSEWTAALTGASMHQSEDKTFAFEDFTADKVRLNVLNGLNPTIWEFRLYRQTPADTAETEKADLEAAIAGAQEAIDSGKADQAEESTRKNFMEIYEYALAIYENPNSDQQTIDRTQDALMEALQNLQSTAEEEAVGKKTLKYFLNRAKAYVADGDTDDCVQSVKELFTEAIADGEAVMSDENATREEVMSAAANLMKAIQALDMKEGNKTDLEMAVELADLINLSKYVEAGQQEFTDALVVAREVLADGDAMQGEIDPAWNALAEAMANLRLKADKSVLEDLLNEAAELDLSNYTEESATIFRTALASAQAVFADAALSEDDQQTVDDAVAALKQAEGGLVAKSEEPGTENPGDSGNTGDQGGDTGSSNNLNTKAAKTGDDTAFIWMLMLAAAGIGAVVTVRRKFEKQ